MIIDYFDEDTGRTVTIDLGKYSIDELVNRASVSGIGTKLSGCINSVIGSKVRLWTNQLCRTRALFSSTLAWHFDKVNNTMIFPNTQVGPDLMLDTYKKGMIIKCYHGVDAIAPADECNKFMRIKTCIRGEILASTAYGVSFMHYPDIVIDVTKSNEEAVRQVCKLACEFDKIQELSLLYAKRILVGLPAEEIDIAKSLDYSHTVDWYTNGATIFEHGDKVVDSILNKIRNHGEEYIGRSVYFGNNDN